MLATLDDLKLHLRSTGAAGTGAALDDDLLTQLLEAASDRIAQERPERTLEPLPALEAGGADTGEPVEFRRLAGRVLQVPDLREVTEIRLDDRDPLTASQYALVRRRPGWPAIYLHLSPGLTYGASEVIITGRWGPADSDSLEPNRAVRHAALVWAARAFHNRTARYADNVQTPDGGIAAYFRQLPPDVLATVNALQIPGV